MTDVEPNGIIILNPSFAFLTLFKLIVVLCEIDSIMWNISHIQIECDKYYVRVTILCGIFVTFTLNVTNIMHITVNLTKHYYEFE